MTVNGRGLNSKWCITQYYNNIRYRLENVCHKGKHSSVLRRVVYMNGKPYRFMFRACQKMEIGTSSVNTLTALSRASCGNLVGDLVVTCPLPKIPE